MDSILDQGFIRSGCEEGQRLQRGRDEGAKTMVAPTALQWVFRGGESRQRRESNRGQKSPV